MRRRWIMIEGELVEVTNAPAPKLAADSGALWSDKGYENCRGNDGSLLDTRTKHREYMKRTGLTTVDDFKGSFEQAAKRRAEFFTSAPDHTRRDDIRRALEKRRG